MSKKQKNWNQHLGLGLVFKNLRIIPLLGNQGRKNRCLKARIRSFFLYFIYFKVSFLGYFKHADVADISK